MSGPILLLMTPSECASELNHQRQLVSSLEKKCAELTARIQESLPLEQEFNLLNKCIYNLSDIILITEASPLDEPGPKIVFVNQAFERITGYPASETLGRSPRFLQGKKTDRRVLREIREAMLQHKFIQTEILNYRKDGTEYWLDIKITPIFDHAGHCTHFAAIQHDITHEKHQDSKIHEQAELLDHARDAILLRDITGEILYWNKGAERMYGWTAKEVIGRNVKQLLYADPNKFTIINQHTIDQGEWHGELQHLNKKKEYLTVEARWTLVRDQEGRPQSVLSINTDITEKKKLELQFMRAQRVESIGILAGGMAHDLNNILAPILMSIEILKTRVGDPQTDKILETIKVSTQRGAHIIRQVLRFARGWEGEMTSLELKDLLSELEKIIQNTFPKNIHFEIHHPMDIWPISADPTQIQQVLLNLCVNARDAMPQGGSLVLELRNCVFEEPFTSLYFQTKPGRYVNINVSDTGAGIPPDILDRIFDPFFSTKELHDGSGLGLSTVLSIVKGHGGNIHVISEPGKGSVFKVYLPAVSIPENNQAENKNSLQLPIGDGQTILIIDDENSILSIASETLPLFGYKVLTALNGAEGVAIYVERRSEIALVITDMIMPIMDGAATIHALRKLNPALNIIAMSGLPTHEITTKVHGAGIRHFLTKPYDTPTLLKFVQAALNESA